MPQNSQTRFKNLAANAARSLKCVWPFWDIIYERVNNLVMFLFTAQDIDSRFRKISGGEILWKPTANFRKLC